MNLRHAILLIAAASFLFGCSNQSQNETAINNANMGTLQTRDRIIRLEADNTYSVLDSEGNSLAQSLNKQQFQDKFPQLSQDLEKAIANGELTIDASMPAHKNGFIEK